MIAAIAEPPQIAVPVPINTHSLPGTRSNLPKQSALRNAALIVASVIDSESIPVFATSAIGRPKPSATIDHCKTCFDEKAIPGVKRASGEKRQRTAIPRKIPITALPIKGKARPSATATPPSTRTSSRPGSKGMALLQNIGFLQNVS